MRRTSEYFSLEFIVQCKPRGQLFYETIAAFNCEEVAVDYADAAYLKNLKQGMGFEYRVMKRGPRDQFKFFTDPRIRLQLKDNFNSIR